MQQNLKEILREATGALARLDADRLEELALSCRALNSKQARGDAASQPGNKEAHEAQRELAVLEQVLAMTGTNVDVLAPRKMPMEHVLGYGLRPARTRIAKGGREHGGH